MTENVNDVMLKMQSPPHVRAKHTTQLLMLQVVIALLPAVFAAYYYFGIAALYHIGLTAGAAILIEAAFQLSLKKPLAIFDGSALITGILIAFNLPPSAPYWIGPVGALIAILIVKQVFGGLGHNFVNPALAARALMLASWPREMVAFVSPFDAVTTVTPLAVASGESMGTWPSLMQLFLGEVGGCIGETSALALMLGGIFLIFRGVIDYRIPAGMLGTMFLMGAFFAPESGFDAGLYHILAGGAMLGAFFMATDYVTSPITSKGRWIYGIAIGFIAMLIRLWGIYPEGVSFAILIMNVATPLIERFTLPRKFGEVTQRGKA